MGLGEVCCDKRFGLTTKGTDDPLVPLDAVQKAFAEADIEIRVEATEDSETASTTQANEQLETRAREEAAEHLDKRDKQIKEAGPELKQELEPTVAKRRLLAWLGAKLAAGWKIVAQVTPVPLAISATEVQRNRRYAFFARSSILHERSNETRSRHRQ